MSSFNIKGFTLIESVVALMLLAILSVMAYQSTEVILGASERSEGMFAQEKKLQQTWAVITMDMLQIRSRPYADGFGGLQASYLTGRNALVSFTTGGGAVSIDNPSGLNRIEYLLNDQNQLVRRSIPAIVSPRTGQYQQRILLEDVQSVTFEQLGEEGLYSPNWPPVNLPQNKAMVVLPWMIRIGIELQNGDVTWKLLPGVYVNG